MKKFVLSSILAITLAVAEQSVYSDSDFVDAETIAKKNSTEIFLLKQKISQLKEKIEGLKSIINSQQNEIAQLKQKSNNNYEQILNELSQRVAKLESMPRREVIATNEQATSQSAASTKNENEDIEKNEPKKEKPKAKKISNKDLYKQSVLNFTKKRLTKAREGFKTLLSKNYKKASCNFYLGEIAYAKKEYKDAISYYQASATIDENASYMDKLLLHTAISLHKIGKKKQAKSFFNAIVASYPDSASAKEAQKYLK
jgi:TolA-binding protein